MISKAQLLSLLKRLPSASNGVAAIELGFCLPLIAGLMVPLTDLAMGAYTKMQVIDAAQAGADYAARTAAYGYNAANISNAVMNATGLSGISVVAGYPKLQCGCANGSTITFSAGVPPCNQTCAVGGPGTFVTVAAQANYTPLFNYPGISNPLTLTAKAVVRIN